MINGVSASSGAGKIRLRMSKSWTIINQKQKYTMNAAKTKKASRLRNIHPGEVLLEEFLKPMEISQYRLAVATGLPHSRVTDLVKGRRGITADTAIRLGRAFGTTPEFWLNLQHLFDVCEAERANRGDYAAISPLVAA
jgi:antitoxin HigA-1